MIEKKNKLISTAKEQETCVLVGVVTREQSREQLTEYLDELAFLAETANARCLKRFTQNLDRPDTRTFIGSGKLQELKEYVAEHKPAMIIFDDELAPSQLRNLEGTFKDMNVKILDRNNLILDIFASRALMACAAALCLTSSSSRKCLSSTFNSTNFSFSLVTALRDTQSQSITPNTNSRAHVRQQAE